MIAGLKAVAVLTVTLALAGCSSIRPSDSNQYPMTRPISTVTEQPINPIIQE